MSACVALSAAAPNIPECMSVAPVRTCRCSIHHAANADHEGGLATPDHRAVEDQRRVRIALIGVDPLDDRVAADLLLAVEREADVDRELAGGCELPHGLDEQEHVPLVVGDPAREETAVAMRELERRRLPEIERILRLNVEVRVAEHRRCRLGTLRGRHLADDERSRAPRNELGRSPGGADLLRNPFSSRHDVRRVRRVGAHGRNGDELGELLAERVGRRRHGRESSQASSTGYAVRASRQSAR